MGSAGRIRPRDRGTRSGAQGQIYEQDPGRSCDCEGHPAFMKRHLAMSTQTAGANAAAAPVGKVARTGEPVWGAAELEQGPEAASAVPPAATDSAGDGPAPGPQQPPPPSPPPSPMAGQEAAAFAASSASDSDGVDRQPIINLISYVRRQQQQLAHHASGGAPLESLVTSALADTCDALDISLDAITLADCMAARGSPEAADKALEFAQRALSFMAQRLSRAQSLVLQRVAEEEQGGAQLPAPAAQLARELAAGGVGDSACPHSAPPYEEGGPLPCHSADAEPSESSESSGSLME